MSMRLAVCGPGGNPDCLRGTTVAVGGRKTARRGVRGGRMRDDRPGLLGAIWAGGPPRFLGGSRSRRVRRGGGGGLGDIAWSGGRRSRRRGRGGGVAGKLMPMATPRDIAWSGGRRSRRRGVRGGMGFHEMPQLIIQ